MRIGTKKSVSLVGMVALASIVEGRGAPNSNSRVLAGDSCTIAEACSLCDAQQRSLVAECSSTGRIQRWQCEPSEDGEDESTAGNAGAGNQYLFRSCKRTKADDEFLMVRFQVMCVVLGTVSFVSARKQKVISASLFDQRKLNIDAKRRRRDSSLPVEEIEMEEIIPLSEDTDFDVV